MITLSVPSVSHHLSFEESVSRLVTSPKVDGVAEFGSHATSKANSSSDYDLLVLVREIPAPVFQMITTIGGRLADVVLIPIETADLLLTATEQPRPRSFDALFAQKMRSAHLLYDATGRLQRVKQHVNSEAWKALPSGYQLDSALYAAWFWQVFGLMHLERMAQAQDPVHLTAFDMMLTSCLPGTWRSYFEIRQLNWEGEKATIRYWLEHDKDYLTLVKMCLEPNDRNEKLAVYRKLVEQTIEPIGRVMTKGETAVILSNSNNLVDVQAVLKYWQSLFAV